MESLVSEDEVDHEEDDASSDPAAPLVKGPSESAASTEAATARPEAPQTASNLHGIVPRAEELQADEDADFDVGGLVDDLLMAVHAPPYMRPMCSVFCAVFRNRILSFRRSDATKRY